jgi:acyl carrier protein phosphodiesterase
LENIKKQMVSTIICAYPNDIKNKVSATLRSINRIDDADISFIPGVSRLDKINTICRILLKNGTFTFATYPEEVYIIEQITTLLTLRNQALEHFLQYPKMRTSAIILIDEINGVLLYNQKEYTTQLPIAKILATDFIPLDEKCNHHIFLHFIYGYILLQKKKNVTPESAIELFIKRCKIKNAVSIKELLSRYTPHIITEEWLKRIISISLKWNYTSMNTHAAEVLNAQMHLLNII